MLQAVWSCLRRRRSLLPVRDLFDADLDHARRKPGCALCRLVQEHDQQVIYSFLWEYCTDTHIGMKISQFWGFCPHHTWSLAVLKHEGMGDGSCSSKPNALTLQKRLLHQQQQRMTELERRVEAYLARFNDAKRERGEVPDIPEAAWAWERLLAFFVGEPALTHRLDG
jgi:hypothetical protein